MTHDDWGITRAIRALFLKSINPGFNHYSIGLDIEKDKEFQFWIFFNQWIPNPWKASNEAVYRHIEEICSIPRFEKGYSPYWVWVKRANSIRCDLVNDDLYKHVKTHFEDLPTYLEIQEEKQKWQAAYGYDKKIKGVSAPIEEEYVQLRLDRRTN